MRSMTSAATCTPSARATRSTSRQASRNCDRICGSAHSGPIGSREAPVKPASATRKMNFSRSARGRRQRPPTECPRPRALREGPARAATAAGAGRTLHRTQSADAFPSARSRRARLSAVAIYVVPPMTGSSPMRRPDRSRCPRRSAASGRTTPVPGAARAAATPSGCRRPSPRRSRHRRVRPWTCPLPPARAR